MNNHHPEIDLFARTIRSILSPMISVVLMIVLSIMVIASMSAVLWWFLKRLSAIELQRWGDRKDVSDEGLGSAFMKMIGRDKTKQAPRAKS